MTTDSRTSSYLFRLRGYQWQDISTGTQTRWGVWDWEPTEGCRLSINQAKVLYDKGYVEMTQVRVGPGRFVQKVVKRKVPETSRIPWFTRFDCSTGRGPDYAAREPRRHA